MKNDRIIRAYDSVNPTQEQKQRMLEAILKKADAQPEKPRKKEPVLYTATPSKTSKWSLFTTIAASLVLLAVSAAVLAQMLKAPESPAYTEPTKASAAKEFPAGPTKYPEYNAIIADFSDYLNGTVTNPIFVSKSLDQLIQDNDAEHTLGWTLRDLDGDGTEELLFTDGWLIYTALSLFDEEEGGGAPILFTSSVPNRYYLCRDDVIVRIYDYTSSGACSQFEFFKVDMDSPSFLDVLEVVTFGPDGCRVGKTEETAKPVDEETGKWTAEEKYPLQAMDVTLLRTREEVVENANPLVSFAPFQKILDQYALAVEQRWDAGELKKAGLNPLIAEENVYDRLGWCIMDHNSDGSGELVISDGELIYELYVGFSGQAIQVITAQDDAQYRMCEVEMYRLTFKDGEETFDEFFTISEGNRETVQAVVSWSGGYLAGQRLGDVKPLSAREAESIFFSHPTVYAPIQLFDPEAAGIDRLSGIGVYDSVLRLYAQSVKEQWDAAKYGEHHLPGRVALDGAWLDLGWCLLDIDGNGQEELLISDGEMIYDSYTITASGVSAPLMQSSYEGTVKLCQNGIFKAVYQNEGRTVWIYYKVTDEFTTPEKTVIYENGEYRAGQTELHAQPISKDEAGRIMSEYIELELFPTRFVPVPEDVYNTDATYAETLQIFRKALTEKWNFGKCQFQYISGHVSDYVENPGQIGYTFLNLDGGEEELIITNGEHILDLYTVRDGVVEQVFSTSIGQVYTMTENKEILCTRFDNGEVSAVTLYRLVNPFVSEENGLVVQESYLRDGRGAWYYSHDGEQLGAHCGDFDVEARLAELAPVEINFRRFN